MDAPLESLLSADQRAVFDAVVAACRVTGAEVYLVGGAIRDWLLATSVGDLDFTVVGDAIAFTRALQQEHGGALLAHEKFRTATWEYAGLRTDFTTARTEEYAHPAMLPQITPSSMADDLRRRDFTINAMALRLSDRMSLDPLNGQTDLQQRILRALHSHSFMDDPTRLLRGARYAARFSLLVEPHTREWMKTGLRYVKDLSGERMKYDLELIFAEPTPAGALRLLMEWNIFNALSIAVPSADQLAQRFTHAQVMRHNTAWDFSDWRLDTQDIRCAAGWGALIYNMGQLSARRWIEWIPFTAELREALVALGALSTLSATAFTASTTSQQSALLSEFSGLALWLGWLYDPDERKRNAMHAQYHVWRHVQPHTSGDDLRALGLPPGPRYRELLERLRAAWLDGEVRNADEEHALLGRLLGHL